MVGTPLSMLCKALNFSELETGAFSSSPPGGGLLGGGGGGASSSDSILDPRVCKPRRTVGVDNNNVT